MLMPLCCVVIPPFHDTVDKAISYLAEEGLVGVADFFVSSKWDLPLRQMPWARRFFWRCAFPSQLCILLVCLHFLRCIVWLQACRARWVAMNLMQRIVVIY